MKQVITIVLGIVLATALNAQDQSRYIVKLTDKKTDTYTKSQPEAFLSEKALERRARYGIAIDNKDLPVSPEYVSRIQKMGYTVTNRIKWLNTLIVEGQGRQALERLSFVKSVQSVPRPKPQGDVKPFFAAEKVSDGPVHTKGLRDENVYEYGEGYNQIAMLNGHMVHNQGYDGEGMTVAVLDAGFMEVDEIAAFDSLWANDQIIDTRNYVNDEDVFSSTISSHGMMVLSTMGGYLPGELVGTAPKADYHLVRTEDASDEYLMEEYYWVDGSEYADSIGADIINSSLGYTDGFNDPDNNHTYEDMNGDTAPVTIGADIAAEKGILVVNSAGNSGTDDWFYIGAPADGDSVMAVGAVDGDSNYVSFSSKGPTYDGRLKPNVAAKGSGATVASSWGGITYASGTSFSSPITAGMVASVWQAMPETTNMELIELIQENSHQYSNPDTLLGYGIPDYNAVLNATGTFLERREEISLSVGPNPFEDYIFVRMQKNHEKVTYSVHAISGKVVKRSTLYPSRKAFRIDLTAKLPKGVYVLRIHTENQTASKKIVKK
ncbi:MAG: S8 family serine peptidase [Bacteroidales bacterium]|nr:S8 family serine peptidase [Bacteroidales bacterium]MCF8333111.1 S8 family serine peptidase [Bacteroidales bacterium]